MKPRFERSLYAPEQNKIRLKTGRIVKIGLVSGKNGINYYPTYKEAFEYALRKNLITQKEYNDCI